MAANDPWTDDELRACVRAYREIAIATRDGDPLNKKAVYRGLLPHLQDRTVKSPELRMQNIASVLWDEGRIPPVKGFLPKSHVGSEVQARLSRILADEGLFDLDLYDLSVVAPTADVDELDRRVEDLREFPPPSTPPPGQERPTAVNVGATTRFKRDPQVVLYVLERAAGRCELCTDPAPFVTARGRPYLEIHHVRQLARGGSDRPANTVALCPNSHRLCHHGAEDAVSVAVKTLFARVAELRAE